MPLHNQQLTLSAAPVRMWTVWCSTLHQKRATEEREGCNTPVFTDPTEQGWKKLSTTSWLQDRLSSVDQDEEGETLQHGEVDLDYALYSATCM